MGAPIFSRTTIANPTVLKRNGLPTPGHWTLQIIATVVQSIARLVRICSAGVEQPYPPSRATRPNTESDPSPPFANTATGFGMTSQGYSKNPRTCLRPIYASPAYQPTHTMSGVTLIRFLPLE
jgi:hypothetical protein